MIVLRKITKTINHPEKNLVISPKTVPKVTRREMKRKNRSQEMTEATRRRKMMTGRIQESKKRLNIIKIMVISLVIIMKHPVFLHMSSI